ncbi:MAG: twin-arginine translocation signal domain-containing protein, partial [Planctomycetota bacterium]
MNRQTSRRSFLKRTTLAGAGFCVVSSSVLAKGQSPNEKLNIGVVGVAGRGGGNMGEVAGENIVALCDVNANNLAGAANRFPQAKTYRDWRKMLDQKDLDAVVC